MLLFRLSFVKNIFYDPTYNGRDISELKYVKLMDALTELGKSVSDEELQRAKQNVKPDFTLHHLFTSVNLKTSHFPVIILGHNMIIIY